MEARDLFVTPIVIVLFLIVAYLVMPYVTDDINRKYFFPALILKFFGAIMLGVIYQFYYHGGDTYNYHTIGSRYVWEAFADSPEKGFDLMFSGGVHHGNFYQYSSKIYFFTDPASFFIVKLAAFFDLFTFSTYSATAICFSVLSFTGMWMFFLTFYRKYPQLHWPIAFISFFIPSVVFWGSGLLKDTFMMGCLGVVTYQVDQLFIQKKVTIFGILLLLFSMWCIFSVKKYILLAFVPASILWIYLGNLDVIRSRALRIILFPIIILLSTLTSYYSFVKVGEGDSKYAIDKLAETAKVTAYDIRYQSGRDAGSGYTLGELDGSFGSMLRLAPQAINVTLFRPYLWEVNNVLMLLSSLESLALLFLTIGLFFKYGIKCLKGFRNPDVSFSFMLSLILAFAVGVSTFNFGTLVRYKIPLLPFYTLALLLIYYENKPKNEEEFESIE